MADQVVIRRRQAREQEPDETAQLLHQGGFLHLDQQLHHRAIPTNSTESAKLASSSEGMTAGHTLPIYVKNAGLIYVTCLCVKQALYTLPS